MKVWIWFQGLVMPQTPDDKKDELIALIPDARGSSGIRHRGQMDHTIGLVVGDADKKTPELAMGLRHLSLSISATGSKRSKHNDLGDSGQALPSITEFADRVQATHDLMRLGSRVAVPPCKWYKFEAAFDNDGKWSLPGRMRRTPDRLKKQKKLSYQIAGCFEADSITCTVTAARGQEIRILPETFRDSEELVVIIGNRCRPPGDLRTEHEFITSWWTDHVDRCGDNADADYDFLWYYDILDSLSAKTIEQRLKECHDLPIPTAPKRPRGKVIVTPPKKFPFKSDIEKQVNEPDPFAGTPTCFGTFI